MTILALPVRYTMTLWIGMPPNQTMQRIVNMIGHQKHQIAVGSVKWLTQKQNTAELTREDLV